LPSGALRKWEVVNICSSGDALKILCFSPFNPFEGAGHAGGEYLFRFASVVAASGASLTLAVPDDGQFPAGNVGWIVVPFPMNFSNRARRVLQFLSTGVRSRRKFGSRWGRSDPALTEALLQADVIVLEFMETVVLAPYIRRLRPNVAIVGTAHDVAIQSNQRARESPRFGIRLRASVVRGQLRRTEVAAYNACDQVNVFNPDNASLLRSKGVRSQIGLAPPWVQTALPSTVGGYEEGLIVFCAAFMRDENDEAARWFLDHVWPTVSNRYPDARIQFVGAGPREWLVGAASAAIEVTGFVDSVEEYQVRAEVLIAPLQRGAGLKFKVLQGLALGRCVVCTTIAAEGVGELLGGELPLKVADTAEEFANKISWAFDNRDERESMGERGRALAVERLDFEQSIHGLLRRYQELAHESRRAH
jgi:hypothetical protein